MAAGMKEVYEMISGTQAKLADQYAIGTLGIPSLELMERASLQVSTMIRSLFDPETEILIACGTGNNGADGLCIARQLISCGYHPEIWVCGKEEKASEEFRIQRDILRGAGGQISFYATGQRLPDTSLLVDAVFGIGLTRELEGSYLAFLQELCRIRKHTVYAVDIPSGIHSDCGKEMGCALQADRTITFGRNKYCLLTEDGRKYAGEIYVKDIGIPQEAYDYARQITEQKNA